MLARSGTAILLDCVCDEAAVGRLAAALAADARPGDVLALQGPLGAGKTVFARAYIRALCGPSENVPSPTFTLMQTYETPAGTVFHFDLYRLADADEAWEIGIEDAFADGISLIEWPERLGSNLPSRALIVLLEPVMPEALRRVRLCGTAEWRIRLQHREDGGSADA